ncbi:Fungal specific transcription factor domain [Geosmithia morbida]|uniref:Fungal specific transcription factor domain n=1 Tax=Geosmithia morbida TaxID=1094350 RepID=A0A9P5D4Q0_9HYPO|nr:Fungal specific transcription factor domain [Geosmithia morbida]KAF4123005.1 Fungal specific transcription factor domain [Geosmithia morbida]
MVSRVTKSDNTASHGTSTRRRQRQPQTSCNHCRAKKLKCNREIPCSSCVTRGLPCHGPDGSTPPRSQADIVSVNPALDARLRALEEAVFGTTSPAWSSLNIGARVPTPAATDSARGHDTPRSDTTTTTQRQKMSSELDYTQPSVGYPYGRSTTDYVDVTVCSPEGVIAPVSGTPGPYSPPGRRRITLPHRSSAKALVDMYLQTSVYTRALFHRASTVARVEDMYGAVERGEPADAGSLALMLSFCAACSSWRATSTGSSLLLSQPRRQQQQQQQQEQKRPGDWIREAWEILGRCDERPTLEGLQARMVLNDVLYDVEGYTSNMRGAVTASISMARDMGLHLVDHPTRGCRDDGDGDAATLEIKRRIWWYLVGTDWCMSCMGGTFDRTYTIHPRHMAVRRPLDIDDTVLDAMSTAQKVPPVHRRQRQQRRRQPPPPPTPSTTHTSVTHLLLRIRAAEICREIADAMPLEAGDVDDLPFDQVLRLDRLFEQPLADLPRSLLFLDGDGDGDDNHDDTTTATKQYTIQVNLLHVALNARRARFLWTFLSSRVPDSDARFLVFRHRCLESARSAVQVSTSILKAMLATDTGGGDTGTSTPTTTATTTATTTTTTESLAASSGVVLAHFFQSCLIVCSDPDFGHHTEAGDPRRKLLQDAFDTLSRVGRESSWGSRLLHRLGNIMQRFRTPAETGGGDGVVAVIQPHPPAGSNRGGESSVGPADDAAQDDAATTAGVADEVHWTGQQQQFQGDGVLPADGACAQLAFGDISWHDFVGVVPGGEDWIQLFTDLDNCRGVL